jgi:cyclopropane fatty-acyl-phospholipid synthase-like methyltransferase
MKEMWDQRFAGKDYFYGTEPNVFFREKLDSLTPGRLLLPAEGEGRNAVYAARTGWTVDAFDYSREGMKKALQLASVHEVSINYHLADINRHDFGNRIYDAVALVYVHLDPVNRPLFHKRVLNSLKPGGFLILEAFSLKQINNSTGGPKSPEMLYTREILKADFEGQELTYLEEVTFRNDEGPGHSGVSDLVRLFMKKPL